MRQSQPYEKYQLSHLKHTMCKYTTRLLLLTIALNQFSCSVLAHSHLADPLPTRQLHCRIGGAQRDCPGPCPPRDDYGRLNPVTQDQPAQTWGRGDTVNVRWHKDNHDGTGFVRLSLVPVDQMMDKGAHDKFAFAFLCMNAGPHQCADMSYNTCGNDVEGMAWQAKVRVPTTHPNGVYVMGWSWYGGGNYLNKSFFGDYYSCSFVKIAGGAPVTAEYYPVYDGNTCISATDRLGVCWKEPCHIGPTKEMIPVEFNNRVPEPIKSSWIRDEPRSQSSLFPPRHESETGSTGGSFAGSGSNSGSSVSLGQRSGAEGRDPPSFGGLGVFFLSFANWNKYQINDNARYRLSDYPKGFTVEAFYDGNVKYMDFFVDDVAVRRETTGPFVMNGNRGARIYGWQVPLGRYVKLQVIAKSTTGQTDVFTARFMFD